jgi:hypothetical protein
MSIMFLLQVQKPRNNLPVLIPAGNLSVCISISQHEPPPQVSRRRPSSLPTYLPACLPDPQVLTGSHSCRMSAFQATGHLAGRQAGRQASEHKTVHLIPSHPVSLHPTCRPYAARRLARPHLAHRKHLVPRRSVGALTCVCALGGAAGQDGVLGAAAGAWRGAWVQEGVVVLYSRSFFRASFSFSKTRRART